MGGMRTMVMLLYVTMTLWIWHLFYFWITITALCIAPFLFNPHQFSFGDFVIDYREFLRWLSRGNSKSHANSWIGYCRLSRTRITEEAPWCPFGETLGRCPEGFNQ